MAFFTKWALNLFFIPFFSVFPAFLLSFFLDHLRGVVPLIAICYAVPETDESLISGAGI